MLRIHKIQWTHLAGQQKVHFFTLDILFDLYRKYSYLPFWLVREIRKLRIERPNIWGYGYDKMFDNNTTDTWNCFPNWFKLHEDIVDPHKHPIIFCGLSSQFVFHWFIIIGSAIFVRKVLITIVMTTSVDNIPYFPFQEQQNLIILLARWISKNKLLNATCYLQIITWLLALCSVC